MEIQNTITKEEILYISFSFNFQLFSVGTNKGFKIYSTHPLSLELFRNMKGGIGIIEILEVSNIMLLCGGGSNPCYPLNKLIIWDDNTITETKELRLGKDIKSAKIIKNYIIVTCENEITIFNSNYDKIIQEQISNEKGIFAITPNPENPMIAFPYKNISDIKIYTLNANDNNNNNNLKKKEIENVHKNKIAMITFNYNGKFLATASEKGTVIRVFNVDNENQVEEFRRGKNPAQIYSIMFDKKGLFLGVCSDTGTNHFFIRKALDFVQNKTNEVYNKKSIFEGVKGLGNLSAYFNSQWSFQNIKTKANVVTKVVFPEDDVIVIINYNGEYLSGKIKGEKYESDIIHIELETSIFVES